MKPIQFTVPVYGEGLFALQEDRKPNFYNYFHRHEELQITYIFQGKGTVMVGNMLQSFQANDVFIMKPNEPHMFDKYVSAEDSEVSIHAIHLFVNLRRMQKLFVVPEFEALGQYLLELEESRKLDPSLAASLRTYFEELVAQTAMPRFATFILLLHKLTLHKQEAVPIYSGANNLLYSDQDGAQISEVYKYTFEHYEEDITLEEVAALVQMSVPSFCKYFKKHTMKTYVSFLHEVRIEKACQLLLNRETENIAQAAFQVGFNTIVHFNRVFKKVMQRSPSEYLRKHRL